MQNRKYDLSQLLKEINEDKKLNDTSPARNLSQDEILQLFEEKRKPKKH